MIFKAAVPVVMLAFFGAYSNGFAAVPVRFEEAIMSINLRHHLPPPKVSVRTYCISWCERWIEEDKAQPGREGARYRCSIDAETSQDGRGGDYRTSPVACKVWRTQGSL